MSIFSSRLKNLRMQNYMTQTELAKRLNVSQNAIFNWESGRREPNYESIERISKIFDVSPSYLIGWDEPSEPTTLAAHFDGNEYTEDELEEIRQFAEFVKSKRGKNSPDVLAAHTRSDIEQTPEGTQHDLDIMNDDSMWDKE